MNSFVVTLLLAVLAQSNASQKKPTEQPCTGPPLVGSWELVRSASAATAAGASTVLKHVTPTHFFVVGQTTQAWCRMVTADRTPCQAAIIPSRSPTASAPLSANSAA